MYAYLLHGVDRSGRIRGNGPVAVLRYVLRSKASTKGGHEEASFAGVEDARASRVMSPPSAAAWVVKRVGAQPYNRRLTTPCRISGLIVTAHGSSVGSSNRKLAGCSGFRESWRPGHWDELAWPGFRRADSPRGQNPRGDWRSPPDRSS